MTRLVGALVGIALACGATGAAQAATVEEVVGRQLAWLGRTDNYLAELRTTGLQTGKLGTVFVDNTAKPARVLFEGDLEFPSKISRSLEISGTERSAAATVAGRASRWQLPQAPFGKSFALFERGMTVDEAMERLRKATSEVTVIENPRGGTTGLRLVSNEGFLKTMDGLLDSMLLGGTLPRGVETTLWFNGEGRLERMVLSESGRDELTTKLEYLDVNLPASRTRKYEREMEAVARAAAAGPASPTTYPSFLEMLLSIKQDDAAAQGGTREPNGGGEKGK